MMLGMRSHPERSEIYDRLEEIQAVIEILEGDIRQIKNRLGPRVQEDMSSSLP